MSIRNVARWAIGDCIECGYLSTDDSPLSTECLMDPPSNYLATCKKADTHKLKCGYPLLFRKPHILLKAGQKTQVGKTEVSDMLASCQELH